MTLLLMQIRVAQWLFIMDINDYMIDAKHQLNDSKNYKVLAIKTL